MNRQETIEIGATMRQALNIIDIQETELNELRSEVRAFRAAHNLHTIVRVNNDELKSNMEMNLHKLSHSLDHHDQVEVPTNQTEMECVSNHVS